MSADLQRGVVRTVAVGDAGEAQHPARLRGHDGLIGRIAGVGTILTETRDHAEHEIAPAEGLGVESNGFATGTVECGQDRVRRIDDQRTQGRQIPGIVEIGLDDPLTACPQWPRAQSGAGVAAHRHHLHDVGTEVGENHGRQTGGGPNAQLDDAEAGKRGHGDSHAGQAPNCARGEGFGQPPNRVRRLAGRRN